MAVHSRVVITAQPLTSWYFCMTPVLMTKEHQGLPAFVKRSAFIDRRSV